jgi:hypothetical protein
MLPRLARWLLFTVVISLMPFIMTGCNLWTDGKLDDVLRLWRYGDLLWPHGELLLVSTAIGAEAAGGLIASSSGPTVVKLLKISTAGGCIILALGSAWWYQKIQENLHHIPPRVVQGTGVLFLVTLCMSFVCKLLAED